MGSTTKKKPELTMPLRQKIGRVDNAIGRVDNAIGRVDNAIVGNAIAGMPLA